MGKERNGNFVRSGFFARKVAVIVIGFLCAGYAAAPVSGEPIGQKVYLTELIQHARAKNLADKRYWHLLLHYRENLTGGYTSEVDDPDFFLAQDGKTNPESELEATLIQLFSNDPVSKTQQPTQCAFKARYEWLKQELPINDQQLPPLPCKRYKNWLAELNVESISLIFPSAFLNNPASMFGHTLLRLNQNGQTEQSQILAYTINYAADVPPGEGWSYAIKGLTGGYQGKFSTIPYYLKIKEYGDIENRDLWEYQLNFTKEQIRWLLMHTWELRNAAFDYYFLKENCSYHLLSLLEIADPNLHLRDYFYVWTVPADTVRVLQEQPGLVSDIDYRPSRNTTLKRKWDQLSNEEHRWVQQIIQNNSVMKSEAFNNLPPDQRTYALEVASDYFRYQSVTDRENIEMYRKANQQILLARSQITDVKTRKARIDPFTTSPEKGHKTSRIGVSMGWREDEVFEELNIRAGSHDLLDPDAGYQPGTQIELLGLTIRHYERRNQYRIERFTLANIMSLNPIDSLGNTPSWKFSTGLQTLRFDSCSLCRNVNVNGGIGGALESNWFRKEMYFAFVEMDANSADGLDENHRIGGGGTLGVLASLTDQWKVLASITYLKFPLGDQSDDLRFFVGQRYTIAQNLALRLEYNHHDHDNDVVLGIHAYF
jgi:Domain of unknown function (DUF4105)